MIILLVRVASRLCCILSIHQWSWTQGLVRCNDLQSQWFELPVWLKHKGPICGSYRILVIVLIFSRWCEIQQLCQMNAVIDRYPIIPWLKKVCSRWNGFDCVDPITELRLMAYRNPCDGEMWINQQPLTPQALQEAGSGMKQVFLEHKLFFSHPNVGIMNCKNISAQCAVNANGKNSIKSDLEDQLIMFSD